MNTTDEESKANKDKLGSFYLPCLWASPRTATEIITRRDSTGELPWKHSLAHAKGLSWDRLEILCIFFLCRFEGDMKRFFCRGTCSLVITI